MRNALLSGAICHSAERPTSTYTSRLIAEPSPNSAATRLKSAAPTSSQLMPPTMSSTRVTRFTVFIALPPPGLLRSVGMPARDSRRANAECRILPRRIPSGSSHEKNAACPAAGIGLRIVIRCRGVALHEPGLRSALFRRRLHGERRCLHAHGRAGIPRRLRLLLHVLRLLGRPGQGPANGAAPQRACRSAGVDA